MPTAASIFHTIGFLVLVNALCGGLYGYSIGFPAVYNYYNLMSQNCSAASASQALCISLKGMSSTVADGGTAPRNGCVWFQSTPNASVNATTTTVPPQRRPFDALVTHLMQDVPDGDEGTSTTSACQFADDWHTREAAATAIATTYANNATAVAERLAWLASLGDACHYFNGMEAACVGRAACTYDYVASSCLHAAGLSPLDQGLLSASLMLGAVFGCLPAPVFVKRYDCGACAVVAGLVGVVGGLVVSIARAADSFAIVLLGRVLTGFGVGLSTVAGPLYVSKRVPKAFERHLGLCFQIFLCFATALASIYGVAAAPNFAFDAPGRSPTQVEWRIQLLASFNTLAAAIGIVIGLAMIRGQRLEAEEASGGRAPAAPPSEDASLLGTESDAGGVAAVNDDTAGGSMVKVRPKTVVTAIFLSAALQLTGINAVMNYAPQIMAAAHLAPMTGNALVMCWNFVTTFLSILASKFATSRRLFLSGVVGLSAACFIFAIPTYPGVTTSSVQGIFCLIGIALFIAAFEMGVGPPFYVLATEAFLPSQRTVASSITQTAQFVFIIVINFGFPLVVQGLSGGAAEDQNKGLALTFVIFGVCGVASAAVLTFSMEKGAEEKTATAATVVD